MLKSTVTETPRIFSYVHRDTLYLEATVMKVRMSGPDTYVHLATQPDEIAGCLEHRSLYGRVIPRRSTIGEVHSQRKSAYSVCVLG